jgi:hypothetical protein
MITCQEKIFGIHLSGEEIRQEFCELNPGADSGTQTLVHSVHNSLKRVKIR